MPCRGRDLFLMIFDNFLSKKREGLPFMLSHEWLEHRFNGLVVVGNHEVEILDQ